MTINCIHCEVTRAKLKALMFGALGQQPHEIVERLNATYSPKYYVLFEMEFMKYSIMRYNSVPPHRPYLIWEKVIK